MKQAPKKILFLITKSNMGGAQRYVFDLATHLLPEEFATTVAFGNAEGSDKPGTLLQKCTEANIHTHYLATLTRDIHHSDWATFKDIYSLLQTEQPDILHLNSSKAGAIGALAGRLCGIKKIIFTAHGWAFFEKRNVLARTVIFLISYFTVLLSHATICISEHDAQAFGRMPFVKNKIKVVQNGIDPTLPLLGRVQARSQLPITNRESDAWIVSVGELTANKNISLGLSVFAAAQKQHENLFYIIVGDGEQRDALIKQTQELGISERVYFTGQLSNASNYLRAFDVLLIPSQKEGVPYVILEAGAAALPVVASKVGGIPEIISDTVSGFVCASDDAAGFIEALTALANDPTKREQFGKELQKTINEKYSLPRMIEQTKALYKK